MNNRLLYGCMLMLCMHNIQVHAQVIKDSLHKIVTGARQDTATARALISFGDIILNENADSALIYYEKSFLLSQKINYWQGQAMYYRSMSYLFGTRKRDKSKGLYYAHLLVEGAKKNNDYIYLGRGYGNMAMVYQRFQQYDSCIFFYEKAMPLIEKYAPSGLPVIYNNMAGVYDEMQLVEKGLNYAIKARSLYSEYKDTAGIISACINIASLYSWNDNNLVKERQVLAEALPLAISTNNKYYQSVLYNNIANTFVAQNNSDSSLYFYNKALVLTEESGTNADKAELLINIASIYDDRKDYSTALSVLEKIKLEEVVTLPLQKSRLFYTVKHNALSGMGHYKEANDIAKKLLQLADSINKVNNKELALGFDEKLKQAEHEKELSVKQLKINRQHNILWLLAAITGGLLLSALFFYQYQRKKQTAKTQMIKALQNEQKLLSTQSSLEGQLKERSRISKEIHDELGSSLTSISLLTEVLKKRLDSTQNPEVNKIGETSADMVDKMNEIIWALNTSNDTINSLIAYTRKFANNFLQDAGIELQFEEDLPLQQLPVEGIIRRNIYLTVKEAVNNIVKHSGATKVNIKVAATDELKIEIHDNGKGLDTKALPGFTNGLPNMKKRMEDIGGSFSISNNGGTVVKIFYPIKA